MTDYPCCAHCPPVSHAGENEHIEKCSWGCDLPDNAVKPFPLVR